MSEAPDFVGRHDIGEGPGSDPSREPWVPPQVIELAPLTDLTLQTVLGDPIDGGGDTTGGTVF